MNDQQHPARRLRHGDRPTEPLSFEDEPTAAERSRAETYNGLLSLAKAAGFTSIGDAIRAAGSQLQAAAPSDLQQLKALALAVGDDAFVDGLPSEAADNFMEAVSPAVVLDLIARIQFNESEFKNFHRSLCARFGYTHDDRHWKRDQVSLEEHIAAQLVRQQAAPALPDVLFDGHAVYKEVLTTSPNPPRTSPDNVAEVLDAVVRIMRRAAPVQAAPAAIPEGWKLVPVESTLEMDGAGVDALPDGFYQTDAERCWNAMLAAAPASLTLNQAQAEPKGTELSQKLRRAAASPDATVFGGALMLAAAREIESIASEVSQGAAPTSAEVRDAALEEAALACEAWGEAKIIKWQNDPEMCEAAKARAWDALQCAVAVRDLKGTQPTGKDGVQ